jgi:IS5 family transposase
VRSERLLVEQIDYNLLFRRFIGLSMDDPVWDHSTFTKNRDRLLEADIARRFFREVVDQARRAKLLSDEHFSVDGTLIQAWASMKRFRPKDGSGSGPGPGRNSERDLHGEKRSNDTHASQTDPEARLYRKSRGQGAQLCYQSHILMENRNGLIVDHELTPASGTGERTAAVDMVTRLPGNHRVTVGADRGYDSTDFIDELRCRNATPHVAQNITNRRSAIDARTTRHPGYTVSQRILKRIKETFGWGKTVGPLRQAKVRGVARVNHLCLLTYAAYNLVRMRNLVGGRAMTLGPWCARNPPLARSGAQKGPTTRAPPGGPFRTPIERHGRSDPFTKRESARFHDNFNGLLARHPWHGSSCSDQRLDNIDSERVMGTVPLSTPSLVNYPGSRSPSMRVRPLVTRTSPGPPLRPPHRSSGVPVLLKPHSTNILDNEPAYGVRPQRRQEVLLRSFVRTPRARRSNACRLSKNACLLECPARLYQSTQAHGRAQRLVTITRTAQDIPLGAADVHSNPGCRLPVSLQCLEITHDCDAVGDHIVRDVNLRLAKHSERHAGVEWSALPDTPTAVGPALLQHTPNRQPQLRVVISECAE